MPKRERAQTHGGHRTSGVIKGPALTIENQMANPFPTVGLYTDESPGLKVDPVVVLVLSLVFIFSVVALHSKSLLYDSVILLPR